MAVERLSLQALSPLLERKMIDHTGIVVSDFDKSKGFYVASLSAIGYELLMEFPAFVTGHTDVAGFGEPPKPDFWISRGSPNNPPVHVAFRVGRRALVDAFYKAAIAAGGRDNGAPGLRPHYHSDYYGAFVLDPDGHNIEAVCHSPE
jgi:catechol 2,3-dioxygenase-like lactoylglutathione lyase family enzyme